MKFEVDLNDRTQLLKAKAELKRVLGIVEYALNGADSANSDTPHANNGILGLVPADQPGVDAVRAAAAEFTTLDIYNVLGGENANRGAIRGVLGRMADAGIIRLIEGQAGRRPGRYAKVAP